MQTKTTETNGVLQNKKLSLVLSSCSIKLCFTSMISRHDLWYHDMIYGVHDMIYGVQMDFSIISHLSHPGSKIHLNVKYLRQQQFV